MAYNYSDLDGESSILKGDYRITIIQVLVFVCICINLLLIVTFFKKDCFHTTARYILFALTLLTDSFLLLISDVLLIINYYRITMQMWLCIIITIFALFYFFITPVTLTAMTLERYVAICMPLHHGVLCSTRRTMHCILIIHIISSFPCIVILSPFFASIPDSFFRKCAFCSVETFMLQRWHEHLRSGISQFYFLIMCIVIVFCYVKIMKVAKAASGENKKSTGKGLRTVVLHAFQLLLCLIQLWCPIIENAVLHIDGRLFQKLRYVNYIIFSLFPRCLSPLVYGLRDETFFHALKSVFGFYYHKNTKQQIKIIILQRKRSHLMQ
uniref:G-protein coupled receptors family 1 profile domain-containing protein n=1 Tax=Sphaeramia orbicularis TaxID=375764 RepID=A0A672YE63_9TELE